MPTVQAYKDPANISKPTCMPISSGENLLDWMIANFSDSHGVSDGLPFEVVLNGESICQWDSDSGADESLIDFCVKEGDDIQIVTRPAGVDPITLIVISVVAAAVAIALAPAIPGDAGQSKTSPNNNLQAASNSFRPGEAIPNLYGDQISYPDFLQPSYFEYVNNLKIVSELFCIGEGPHEVTDVKSESTLIDSIDEWSYQVFQPGNLPGTDITQVHTGTDQVDGQVLLAPNSSEFFEEDGIDSVVVDVPDPGEPQGNTVINMKGGSTFIQDTSIERGDHVRLLALGGNPQNPTTLINGTYLVDTVGASSITIASTDGVSGVATFRSEAEKVNSGGEIENWVGWFNIRGDTNVEQIWFHWQMPRGIRANGGGELTVEIEFQIQELDDDGNPTGPVLSITETKSGNDINAQFVTTKYTPPTPGRYQARARKINDYEGDSALAEVKVEDFVGVFNYSSANFGNVTCLSVERRATTFAVSQSSSKINCMARSLIPTYNRETGEYQRNVLATSRSFADTIAHLIIVKNGRSETAVDLEELYAIYDGLPYPDLGYFDFTFDDFDVSLGERVRTASEVARVSTYRDGAIWRFTRDESRPIRSAMFNRRAMTDRDVDINVQLVKQSDPDTIALTYVDPETNTERVIYRHINYNTQEILEGVQGNYTSEINLAGCRNEYQANNRADLEIRRLAYQRTTVKDTVLRDGLLVGLRQRVGWVDPNDSRVSSGEIFAVNGLEFDTSERFPSDREKSYFVYLTTSDGSVSRTVNCSPRDDTDFGFIASGIRGAFPVEQLGQAGSRYFIGTEDDIEAADFLVNKRTPNEDGSVTLELVEYVEKMYERDSVAPS